jgi:hypothetical protein
MQRAGIFRRGVLALVGLTMASTFLVANHVSFAQDVEDATREACKPDALRLCGQFVPDVDRITDCMTEKFKEVSPQCRAAMIKEDARARARPQGRRTPTSSD